MSEKIVGYLLIVVGVVAIILATLSVFMVFTKQAQPVPFIVPGPMVLNLQLPLDPAGGVVDVPIDLAQFMPVGPLTNIFIHLVLMGFVAGMGSRLAMIGTNLVRPIVIKTKE